MKKSILLVVVALISGCGAVPRSTGAMKLGPDTYRISSRASLGNVAESQKMALSEAESHCQAMGREMMVIGTLSPKSTTTDPYEVTFRCLTHGDPELHRPNLKPVPDTVIQVQ